MYLGNIYKNIKRILLMGRTKENRWKDRRTMGRTNEQFDETGCVLPKHTHVDHEP